MAKYLNLTGLQTLWTKIKAVFAPKENGVYYVPGTSGYANWSANTAYAVGANVVNPSGECWTCKTAHTSGSSWSSTNWNRISAVALTGTIDGVTALYAGLKIAYRFQVLGGEGSTTLNVNNLGAKTITRGTGAFYRWTIGRNGVAILVYDGSAWRFGDYDSNDQYVLPDAYCSTAAGTQAKAATSIGFSYSRHNNIPFRINFINANTYDGNLTLNVNSQGAKPLWINGSASSSSNKTIVVGVYWCYYDGTQFQLWTDKSLWAYKYRGDGSSLTETFSAASSRANIASGESNATIFGKIAKWLGDLKALAFKDKVGTGDVESGTYGISVSGNAATASAAQSGSALETAINGKYAKPSGGIPKTDLASAVQTSLGKADSALQSESDPVFSASPAAGITSNDISNWNGKVNKSEMSVTPGTGGDADKTTIQLKSGTSATVLTQHQDLSGKQDVANLTNVLDLADHPDTKYPNVWAVYEALSEVTVDAVSKSTAYVEAMHVATSYSTANFINVGMYDYAHNDDAVYYPTSSVNPDGVIGGGTFDSIVMDKGFSWFPCSRGAQEFYLYHLWTGDFNGSFHLENLFNTALTPANPARRFRLVITNDCDYKFNLTFDKNTGSTDISIMSNIAETSSSLTVEIPGNSTIAIDVLIPRCFAKFGITQMCAVIRVYPVVMQVHNSKVSTVYNMNDFTNPGTYQIVLSSKTTNKPTSVNGRMTLQVTNSDGYINQMILDEYVYYRVRTSSGSWGAWKKFTTETA